MVVVLLVAWWLKDSACRPVKERLPRGAAIGRLRAGAAFGGLTPARGAF